MQDKQTGEMVPVRDRTQDALDEAIPDRKRQGVVLRLGENVRVKGGRFVVHSIGRKMIVLRGLPGTRVKGL